MTDVTLDTVAASVPQARRDIGLKKRYAAERRFRLYGVLAILVGLAFLAVMLVSIVGKGYTSFWQTTITLFFLTDQMIGPDSPLAEYGLVSAPEAERKGQREAFDAGKTM